MKTTYSNKPRFSKAVLAVILGLTSYAVFAAKPAPAPAPAPAPTMALLQNNDNAPISPELKAWLAKNNVKVLALIDAQGQAKAIDADGKELKSCGKIEGTRMTGNCRTANITPTAANNIRVLGFTPPAGAPVASNSSAKATVDDPCLYMDFAGYLTLYCW